MCGSHKRNAYQDILEAHTDDYAEYKLSICRDGLYDILPEGLFHPIDRFENIPANEYQERFADECEKQQLEETNARLFFKVFDTFLMELNCIVSEFEQIHYSDNTVLSDIICDSMPESYKRNRFCKRVVSFLPQCNIIRGNKVLLSLMLRKVLFEENLYLTFSDFSETINDENPRYNSCLDDMDNDDSTVYLGNEFIEDLTIYTIRYWNDDECNSEFLTFVSEIEEFEKFINDFFVGIESRVKFDISTDYLSVRLSDDVFFNYLNYNTNI